MDTGFQSLRLPILLVLLAIPFVSLAHAQEEVSFFRDIYIEQNTVADEAVCIACSIFVEGELHGDAIAVAGDIELSGSIAGDAITVGGGILTHSGAKLEGEAIAVGGPANIAPGTVEREIEEIPYFFLPGQRSFYLIGTLVFIGVNLSLLMLTGLILRSRLKKLAAPIKRRPFVTLAAGLALIILFGWLEDSVSSSEFGEVIAALMGVLFCLSLLVGYSAVSWSIGSLILPGRGLRAVLFAGATATTLLLMVPLFGLVPLIIIPILSIGCLLMSGLGTDSDWFVARIFKRTS